MIKKMLLPLVLLLTICVQAKDRIPYIAYNDAAEPVHTSTDDYSLIQGSHSNQDLELSTGFYAICEANVKRYQIIVPDNVTAFLILCDGASFTGGIHISEKAELNIYGQQNGTGTINAIDQIVGGMSNSFVYNAPIGGRPNSKMGTLKIHGGIINATASAGSHCAGIGGGSRMISPENDRGGNVTIYNGTVTAQGDKYGAGIGGGKYGDGGTLTVYGGSVTARGGDFAAGIGGGQDGNGATVNIYGGTVNAYGGDDAAGIGSGEQQKGLKKGGKLIVHGGHVFADGTGWGAGIGGGEDSDGAEVEIYGGTVEAWAGADAAGKNGSAIGSEDGDGHYGSLKIVGELRVYAGQNPDNASSSFTSDVRVPACRWRPYARIEPCTHQRPTYTIEGDFHTAVCRWCGLKSSREHEYHDGTCSVCGYKNGNVWAVSVKRPATDNNNVYLGYYGTNTTNVVKGSEFVLEDIVTVKGYRFKGWVKNSVSEGLEAAAGAVFVDEEDYVFTVNEDVSFTAHYEPINEVTVSVAGSDNGGYVFYKDTVVTGSRYDFPSTKDYGNYSFVGWYVGNDIDFVNGSPFVPVGGVTYNSSTGKFSVNGQVLKNPGETLGNVSANASIIAIYVRSHYGAITIAPDHSNATIDGAYLGEDAVDIPGNMTVQSVTLDRTFVKDQFSTVVFPFEIAVSNVQGANFYGFTEMSNTNGKWTAGASAIEQSGTLTANTPYLVKPTTTSITFVGPVTLNTSGSHKTFQGEWEFQGTYQYTVFGGIKADNPQNTYYGFAANTQDGYTAGQFAKAGDNAFIYPMRAYLVHVGANSNPKDASGLGNMGTLPETIDVKIMDEQGNVTETVILDTRSGEIARDRWFDLQGRALKGKPSIKGRYLHNGKVEAVR